MAVAVFEVPSGGSTVPSEVGSAPPVTAEPANAVFAPVAASGAGAPRSEATGEPLAVEGEAAGARAPVESEVVGADCVEVVVAGPCGSTIVGLVVGCAAVEDVTGEVEVVGMLVDGVGTVGRTIVGVVVLAEGRLDADGGVIVVDVEGTVVDGIVVAELVAEGMLIDGTACWAKAEVEPSARTAAMAVEAQNERVGTMCVMNTTMRFNSKSYSLTCANPDKTK